MNPRPIEPTSPFNFPAAARNVARYALLALLAGHVIFNRPFAKLGFPPLYISEMILGVLLFAACFDFKMQVIAPLRESRALQFVALFCAYGSVRAVADFLAHGMDAARDAVICSYALFALVAPGVLRVQSSKSVLKFVAIITSLGAALAGGIYLGVIAAPEDIKVDFLTLSVALALAAWTCTLLNSSRVASRVAAGAAILLCVLLLAALPTRALWPTPVVITVLLIITIGFNRRRGLMLLAGAAVAAIALSVVLPQVPSVREKIAALVNPNDADFQTPEGQRGAHSVKWRLLFWKRCISETLDRAPVLGLGFGMNLTDLLRRTPEWQIFEDSQNAAKYGSPNRHPHSAHVTVFTRLGFIGLLLWLVLLIAVFMQGLKNCWMHQSAAFSHELGATFWTHLALLMAWTIYILAMSFGVVLENPFGGVPFWVLTGLIATPGVFDKKSGEIALPASKHS